METFEYKVFGTHWKVSVDKTMISFEASMRSQNIPRGTIHKIGISIPGREPSYAGNHFGLAGLLVKKGIGEMEGVEKNIDFHQLPKTSFLTISYNETPEKMKEMNIMLNSGDENCIRMLKKIEEDFSDLYVGAGAMSLVRKALGLSDTKNTIVAIVMVILFIGITALYQTRHLFNSYL